MFFFRDCCFLCACLHYPTLIPLRRKSKTRPLEGTGPPLVTPQLNEGPARSVQVGILVLSQVYTRTHSRTHARLVWPLLTVFVGRCSTGRPPSGFREDVAGNSGAGGDPGHDERGPAGGGLRQAGDRGQGGPRLDRPRGSGSASAVAGIPDF